MMSRIGSQHDPSYKYVIKEWKSLIGLFLLLEYIGVWLDKQRYGKSENNGVNMS